MSLAHKDAGVEVAGQKVHELTGDDRKLGVSMLFGMMKLQRARNRDQFPGANPVSIERCMIPRLRAEKYVATAKTDGERFLMMAVTLRKVKVCLFIDRAMRMFIMPGSLPTMAFENSLLDGELVQCQDQTWHYLVFDCIYLSGLDLASHRFSSRLWLVKEWLADVGSGLSGVRIAVKKFVAVASGQRVAEEQRMPIDGLIFVPEATPYVCFKHDTLFKWKADRQHTVDFRAQDNKLCVLSKNKLVEKAKIHPDDSAANGAIVECRYDGKQWRVVKVRNDKSSPNDLYVYSKTLLNIQEDIQRSELGV